MHLDECPLPPPKTRHKKWLEEKALNTTSTVASNLMFCSPTPINTSQPRSSAGMMGDAAQQQLEGTRMLHNIHLLHAQKTQFFLSSNLTSTSYESLLGDNVVLHLMGLTDKFALSYSITGLITKKSKEFSYHQLCAIKTCQTVNGHCPFQFFLKQWKNLGERIIVVVEERRGV